MKWMAQHYIKQDGAFHAPNLHVEQQPARSDYLNKMKAGILLAVIVSMLAGCAIAPEDFGGARKPRQSLDEFTGIRTESIHTSPIGGLSSELKSPARITLTLSRISDRESNTNLMLTVNYNGLSTTHGGFGWLFISPGKSLTFLIDGETFALSSKDGSQNYREVGHNAAVHETASYSLPFELAERIVSAKVVKMRLSGQSYNMDKTFNESNRETFEVFARKVSTGEPFVTSEAPGVKAASPRGK